MGDLLSGIPRVDPTSKPTVMRRAVGLLFGTKAGSTIHRSLFAPLDLQLMRMTRGRFHTAKGSLPVVMLRTTGAKSGARREVTLAYFTDGDDVILIASNYGQEKHPNWYYNLLQHPRCELFADGRTDSGGGFVAHPTEGADHDRLYALMERFSTNFTKYATNTDGIRAIPVLRLTPEGA
jgi:deazaflavin-dependent oxidoreductase (nitroreductase family)